MINQNLVPAKPTLRDVLNLVKKETKLEINCHHVGKIESFDSDTQTASVSINYTQTIFTQDTLGNQITTTPSFPVITNAPIIALGGGETFLTFPIAVGDECLVLFNDRNMDGWLAGNSNSPPESGRFHSFSDAIILVGVRSLANVIPSYSTTSAEFRTKDGNTKVTVDGDKVSLVFGTNNLAINGDDMLVTLGSTVSLQIGTDGKLTITNATAEFVAAIVKLFTDIQSATTTTMLGPQPLIMPTFAADLVKLQSFKS